MPNRLKEYDSGGLSQLVESAIKVLVHFGTDWCAPCKRLERVLCEMLDGELGDFTVVKVNVEDYPDAARMHGVTKNPTLCYFVGGTMSGRREGFADANEILRFVGRDTD